MAQKTTKKAELLEAGPRMLCLWHGDDRWYHALVWTLRAAQGTVGMWAVHTDDGRVVAHHYPATSMRYCYPTVVNTTVHRFELYLKGRLLTSGGNADAYAVLGVEKPTYEGEADATPKVVPEELGEMYARAARLLEQPMDELKKKYGHLNNGLQMMNLRNRLRAKGHNI